MILTVVCAATIADLFFMRDRAVDSSFFESFFLTEHTSAAKGTDRVCVFFWFFFRRPLFV